MVLVFSKNTWTQVALPVGHDPSWVEADGFFYAATFVAAAAIFSQERALIIAEAAVHKRLYPGIMYDKQLEADLRITWKEHESPQHQKE
jgi:hypothetical protein